MTNLSIKIRRLGETTRYVEPEIYAIKLSKTPVALIQLETIEYGIPPKDPETYYAIGSRCEINRIMEFRKDYPKKAFFYNNHWKLRAEAMLEL